MNLDFKNLSWDTTMYSAIIAAVVSFLVWWLTVYNEKKNKKKDQKRLDESNLTFLSFLLIGAISTNNRQLEVLKDYIESLTELNSEYEPLGLLPNPDLQTISERIDQEKYFASYINVYQKSVGELERFKNIFTSIYFLHLQLGKLHQMTDAYYQDLSRDQTELSRLFSYSQQEISKLALAPTTPEIAMFLSIAGNHHNNYKNARTSPADFNAALEKFIKPMQAEIVSNFTELEFAQSIALALHSTNQQPEKIGIKKKGYTDEIIQVYNGMAITHKGLRDDAIPIIEQYTPINNSQRG